MATEPLYLTVLRQEHTIAVDLTEVAPVVPRGCLQIEDGLLTEIGEELTRITALANKWAALGASGVAGKLASVEGAHRDVQRLGALIFAHLLPASVQQRLATGQERPFQFLNRDLQRGIGAKRSREIVKLG